MAQTNPSSPMRERILAAAVRVIAYRGVVNSTTKEIARAAGVSEGSLYNHFENKTALFGAAFGAVAGGMREGIQALVAGAGREPVVDNLARFVATATRFYGALLPMAGSVLADRDVVGWLQQTGRAGGPAMGQGGLVRYLEMEQAAGRLKPGAQPPYLAAALLGACQHRAFTALLGGSDGLASAPGLDGDVNDYARGLVAALLDGQFTT